MMNLPQMMMQAMMQGVSPMRSPMIQEIVKMKQQGVSPQAAMQQLAQRYPQFRQAIPYLQNKTPQQMDQTAQTAIRSSGVDPDALRQQFNKFV